MSHFSVLIITPNHPSQTEIAAALQPFHEFECTGVDDQYVQDLDDTDEVRESFTGKGEVDFAEWAEGYYGRPIIRPGEAIKGKYGYIRVDDSGQLVRSVDRTNPNRKWDWWEIGGRWSNFLLLRDGTTANLARKADVDFSGKSAAAAEKAGAEWRKVRRDLGSFDGFLPFRTLVDRYAQDYARARTEYHAQPLYQRQLEQRRTDDFYVWFNLESYAAPYEDFVRQAAQRAHQTFALLKDGVWYEKGEMGWFACVSGEQADWPDQFDTLLADVPDSYWLTVVDCHI